MMSHALGVAAVAVEPLFRPDGDARVSIEAAGRRVTLALDPDGWLVAAAPVAGSPDVLLERQAGIMGLAKVALASEPVLLAEMPATPRLEDRLRGVLDALRSGLATLDNPGTPEPPVGGLGEATEVLETYASSCRWERAKSEACWSFRIATANGRQRIVGEPLPGFVRFSSTLAALRNPSPDSRRALSHFLTGLNGRLRFARAALTARAAVLEVVLRVQGLDTPLIERAVGALLVGSAAARRESVALLDPELAGAYCSFHLDRRAT
jgi:hypothetical protein